MKRHLLKTAIALLLAGAGVAFAQTTPIKLRFSHSGAEADSQHLAALEFAKRVKERTRGAIEIGVYPNSTLGNDNTALSGVRGGTIDMSMSGNPYFTGLVPKLNALESRAIDGHENPPQIMHASKMYEMQKYLSMTRHAYTAMPLVMNKARFDAMSAEHQKTLLEEAQAAARFQRAYNAKHEVELIAQLRAKGMQVDESPDIASIRAVVRDETRKLYIEKNGDAVLKAIESAH